MMSGIGRMCVPSRLAFVCPKFTKCYTIRAIRGLYTLCGYTQTYAMRIVFEYQSNYDD